MERLEASGISDHVFLSKEPISGALVLFPASLFLLPMPVWLHGRYKNWRRMEGGESHARNWSDCPLGTLTGFVLGSLKPEMKVWWWGERCTLCGSSGSYPPTLQHGSCPGNFSELFLTLFSIWLFLLCLQTWISSFVIFFKRLNLTKVFKQMFSPWCFSLWSISWLLCTL